MSENATRVHKVELNGVEYTVLDISGLSKAALLAAMHNCHIPKDLVRVMQKLNGAGHVMTEEDAQDIINKKAAFMLEYADGSAESKEQIYEMSSTRPIDYLECVADIALKRDEEGKVDMEKFNRRLYEFDYVLGRAIQGNLAGDIIVVCTKCPSDLFNLQKISEETPELAIQAFGRDITVTELYRAGCNYESDKYLNSPGKMAEIVNALAQGQEPPNAIPELVDKTTALMKSMGIIQTLGGIIR